MTWRDYGDGVPTYQTPDTCIDCDGDCRVCQGKRSRRGRVRDGDRVRVINHGGGWDGTVGTVVPNDERTASEFVKIDHLDFAPLSGPAWFMPDRLELVSTEPDPVNHPAHYTQYPVEVIEITKHLDFPRGNVVKYVTRSPHKGSEVEDLKKARWYLDLAIEMAEKSNE